jgi:hypothetical protein
MSDCGLRVLKCIVASFAKRISAETVRYSCLVFIISRKSKRTVFVEGIEICRKEWEGSLYKVQVLPAIRVMVSQLGI